MSRCTRRSERTKLPGRSEDPCRCVLTYVRACMYAVGDRCVKVLRSEATSFRQTGCTCVVILLWGFFFSWLLSDDDGRGYILASYP